MTDDSFFSIWNQIVLCSQCPIYGDVDGVFGSIEKQILEANANKKITVRQYVLLQNANNEWRDIRARTSPAEEDGAEEEGVGQVSDLSRQDGRKKNLV